MASALQIGTNDPLVAMMKRDGIPVTRQNYLQMAYPTGLPEWSAELEAEMPPELQDWSQFTHR